MAFAGLRLRVLKEEALRRSGVMTVTFRDGQLIGAGSMVDNAGNTRREVRRVGLKGTRAERFFKGFLLHQIVIDGVRLVAVCDNSLLHKGADRMIDDERGSVILDSSKALVRMPVSVFFKDAVAAVSLRPMIK